MPFEPLRFIHASNLSLDHQLVGTGPLPADICRIVEDSTLEAFESVIAACIEQQVDFLLLTGNSFVDEDRSLRARIALVNGFQRLAKHGIRVFVMPGAADPPEAWRAIPNLPENVTPFYSKTGDSVALIRDGKVIASVIPSVLSEPVESETASRERSRFVEARRVPFRIGMLTVEDDATLIDRFDDETQQAEQINAFDEDAGDTEGDIPDSLTNELELPMSASDSLVDYLALGGGDIRQAIALDAGIAHNPGGTQGIGPLETGPHGCTLVKVEADGSVETTFISTAPVRWEWFEAEVDAQTCQEELVDMMRSAVEECRPELSEKVFLIRWTMIGSGPLFDGLKEESSQKQLIEACEFSTLFGDGRLLNHVVHFRPDGIAAIADEGPAADYFETLEAEQPLSRDMLAGCVKRAALPVADWENRLQALIPQLDQHAVVGYARQLGMNWFSTTPEEKSSS